MVMAPPIQNVTDGLNISPNRQEQTCLQWSEAVVEHMKATAGNPRVSLEKLFPKESVEGADTVLRGSVRAPKGF